jgi:hypothetical protein
VIKYNKAFFYFSDEAPLGPASFIIPGDRFIEEGKNGRSPLRGLFLL